MDLYPLLRPLLFGLAPETAHNITLQSLKVAPPLVAWLNGRLPTRAPQTIMGLEFPNCVGLAAGLDKNADCIDGLGALGFGFVEVGTVTPRPQPGNSKPRMFRLPQAKALINRMGFNNQGVEYLLNNVEKRHFKGILGINIGKNFDTPLEKANEDYLIGLRKTYMAADYITVNISSPNTPGLRQLQHGDYLATMLSVLKEEQDKLHTQYQRYVPLAVKIAPDVSSEELAMMSKQFLHYKIDAVIATNTTSARDQVNGLPYSNEAGGLSGAPLTKKSTETVRQLVEMTEGQLPIIAAGGIMSAADAQAKLNAGACLIQLYTGLIYRGPALVKEILNTLS